jgi:ribose transport system permease protein
MAAEDSAVRGGISVRGSGMAVLGWARKVGAVLALLLLIVIFTILKPDQFLSSNNVISILQQVSVVGILALGLTVALIVTEFDLSIGFVGSLAGMLVCGWMSKAGMAVPLAIILALGVGAFIGLLNGLIVTQLRVNAFIGTLAMGSVVAGAIGWYSVSPIITGIPKGFTSIGQGKVWGIPGPVLIMVFVAIVLFILCEKTVPGRRMYAIGGNAQAARLSGVPVDRYRILAFIISGLCAAAAGVVLASSLGSGQPAATTGFLLDAFAAAFLGAATWRDGEFHIGGTIVGVLIIGVIFNGLSLLNAPSWLNEVMRGGILILGVGASGILRRQRV